jgi:hypothetical protein
MADFENQTPFGAVVLPSMDRDGLDLLLIVVAAQFELPPPNDDAPGLRLWPTQEKPPMVEEYSGEPGRSSIRRDGQSSYFKPATDIHVIGDACAHHGEPVMTMDVRVRVGPCAVTMRVHGDRVWRAAKGDIVPSDPEPFVTMPLIWERAYGGRTSESTEERPDFEARNPIGCGYESNRDSAIGRPLPNLDHPAQPLQRISDRPVPLGLSPTGRDWQPRVRFAGTFDEAWKRGRAPLWPVDFDERFFCSAPTYLQASPHLTGGEPVALEGLHAEGSIHFHLPMLRLQCHSRFVGRATDRRLVLDGVLIETARKRLTLYYRASIAAPLSLVKHRLTSLYLVRPGADAIAE